MPKMIALVIAALVSLSGCTSLSYSDSAPSPQREAATINIIGEVNKPEHYAWFKGMTVLDAIDVAGGLTQSKNSKGTVLIWPKGDARKRQVFGSVYTFHEVFGSGKKPIVLDEGDTISVGHEVSRAAFPSEQTPGG
jgi:protein involved in polysaccharide export with SLBB domain